ncbi:BrnA antitoxin family protein [Thiomicrospira microaerophila]|uniref:BrnA antitoxin family protein n=1 Tax=Thiomicrospira microaerophila TaxID=406020 RepID=UPI0005C8709D|nr:BrnA antitoxin family protein [Thiomicrospira microaerophila]
MNANSNDLNSIYDDLPELGDDFFQQADLRRGDDLIRPGRPKAETIKQPVTIRLDAPIVDYFKSTGKGWQTRLNDALNQWIKEHAKA